MSAKRLYLILPLLALPFFAMSQKAVPALWGQRIHDEAGVLQPGTVQQLEQQLKVFEDSTSNQIAVLVIPSLDGDILEEYALRVAEEWKLGTKDKDNGAVLLISIGDKKARIEVGQGLEGPLPDAMCGRIIRNELAPAFRRGDYDGGIQATVNAIMMAVKGEYKADPKGRSMKSGGGGSVVGLIIVLIIFILIARSKGGRSGGYTSGGGWYIGGGGGSSWGGDSGGFSGGGGSFGGGGASGSW